MKPWHLFVIFLAVRLLWVSVVQFPIIIPDEFVYLAGSQSIYYFIVSWIGYHNLLILNAILASLAVFPLWWIAERWFPEKLILPITATISMLPVFWIYTPNIMTESLLNTLAMFFFWACLNGNHIKKAGAVLVCIKSIALPYALAAVVPLGWLYFGIIGVAGAVAVYQQGMGLTTPFDILLNLLKSGFYLLFAPGFGLGLLGLTNLRKLPKTASFAILGVILAALIAATYIPSYFYFGRYFDSIVPILALLGAQAALLGQQAPKWIYLAAFFCMGLGWLVGGFMGSYMDASLVYVQFGLFLPAILLKNREQRVLLWLLLPALATITLFPYWAGVPMCDRCLIP